MSEMNVIDDVRESGDDKRGPAADDYVELSAPARQRPQYDVIQHQSHSYENAAPANDEYAHIHWHFYHCSFFTVLNLWFKQQTAYRLVRLDINHLSHRITIFVLSNFCFASDETLITVWYQILSYLILCNLIPFTYRKWFLKYTVEIMLWKDENSGKPRSKVL